ncbi:phage integrase SAM-like domain-containing protein [Adhaeribacter sp. BT258]|uniref:Phage integrase SAM-like domain-containing protein n=1 Tax=Adhaeribacter terrigena TaxID=2793070 RepID=A0ABS1BXL2_9BACT|nr:phage integrase SAM-like domain-containing protein [Adhaeribacter terrigena]MBK0401881.1 phage integrase SAM-like domain-containing protein [Adhaeribacter terrigena]
MARLNEYTSLVAVKEREKNHIKILYTKDGKIKRFKTNIYVKDAGLFNEDKIYRKTNAIAPNDYQTDKTKLDNKQLRIESIIEGYVNKHHDKPTPEQVENLLTTYKEESKVNYSTIQGYLEDYHKLYEKKERNKKSVVNAVKSGYEQFCTYKNMDYSFDDIGEEFFKDLINYLLFNKPKNQKQSGTPNHLLTAQVIFDDRFGMNNNTLLKRLDALMSFFKWAINKGVNLDYEKLKLILKNVKKELQISEFTNLEFAFKKREDVKLLSSSEFDGALQDDSYIEFSAGQEVSRSVSKEILIRSKDYFVISILTANRISDLKLIKRHHLEMGKQKAQKTNNEFLLNSNQTIKDLLEKHDYTLGMSDQKYNKCIKVFLKQFYQNFLQRLEKVWVKEIRGKYEQYKEVEYHTLAASHSGRRSFASILYNEGRYPKRMIMSFTGHTSEQEFDKYIQLSPIDDIQEVSEFLNINYI